MCGDAHVILCLIGQPPSTKKEHINDRGEGGYQGKYSLVVYAELQGISLGQVLFMTSVKL